MFDGDHTQKAMAGFLDEKIKSLAKVPLPIDVMNIERREQKISPGGSPPKKVAMARAELLSD